MDPSDDLCRKTPEIEYPCDWEYRIIGLSKEALVSVAQSVLKDHPHSIKVSNQSKNGKYISLAIETIVHSDSSRVDFYNRLKASPEVIRIL